MSLKEAESMIADIVNWLDDEGRFKEAGKLRGAQLIIRKSDSPPGSASALKRLKDWAEMRQRFFREQLAADKGNTPTMKYGDELAEAQYRMMIETIDSEIAAGEK